LSEGEQAARVQNKEGNYLSTSPTQVPLSFKGEGA